MNKSAGPTNSNTSVGRTSLVLLLVIALLNTIGITIIVPIVPFLTLRYLAHPNNLAAIVGWLFAAWDLPVDRRARFRRSERPFWATPHSLHLSPWFRGRLSHLGPWRCALVALPRTHHRWLDRRQHQCL